MFNFFEHKENIEQLLIMSVRLFGRGIDETFYTKMNKDGRITIPKINAELIKTQLPKEATINQYAFEITLRPA